MGESRAITGLDRLPWLADDGAPARRARPRGRMIAIALLVLGVAALSYWLGTRSWNFYPDWKAEPNVPSDGPLPLPEAVPALPEPEVLNDPIFEPLPVQTLEPVPVPAKSTPPARPPSAKRADPPRTVAKAKPVKRAEQKPAASPRVPWPVRKVEGSAGRLVQVGTFSTRRQAKRGWHALMRVNPSLQRLPALVVPVQSRRDDKLYYRLQMGTTSQAHSVVLCQRLRMIGQSCIVVAEPVEKAPE